MKQTGDAYRTAPIEKTTIQVVEPPIEKKQALKPRLKVKVFDVKNMRKKEIIPRSICQGKSSTVQTEQVLHPPAHLRNLTLQHLSKPGNYDTIDLVSSVLDPKDIVSTHYSTFRGSLPSKKREQYVNISANEKLGQFIENRIFSEGSERKKTAREREKVDSIRQLSKLDLSLLENKYVRNSTADGKSRTIRRGQVRTIQTQQKSFFKAVESP